MNNDPMDPLNAFYVECRTAPVPESLTTQQLPMPWWLRLSIPLGGLSFGGIIALMLIAGPKSDSERIGAEAAQAMARVQFDRVLRQSENVVTSRPPGHVRGEVPVGVQQMPWFESMEASWIA